MREFTNDELAKLTDEKLRELFLKVRGTINKGKKNNSNVVKEEIYYCYICREIERRSN
tara:strand:+ start:205 stop:378 length:174 start_codon:yes stop_codon:yes gene_type:complete